MRPQIRRRAACHPDLYAKRTPAHTTIWAVVPHKRRRTTVTIAWMGESRAVVFVDPPQSELDKREILSAAKRKLGLQAMLDEHAGQPERARVWRDALGRL